MTIAYWMLIAAVMMPYLTIALAKSAGGVDNRAPFSGRSCSAFERTAPASSTTPQSPHPVVCAADRQASRQCRIGNFPALLFDPTDHQEPTLRCQASIVAQVHPGSLPIMLASVATHSLTRFPRVKQPS